MANELSRITVNLIPSAADALVETVRIDRLSQTDVVNRALQVYAFVARNQRLGKALLLRAEDGQLEQVHIV